MSSQTNPSKTAGQWHSAKGEVKKGLGATVGSNSLKEQGQEEHTLGQAEIRQARKTGGNHDTGPSSGQNIGQDDDQSLNQSGKYPGSQTSGYVEGADSTGTGTGAGFGNDIGSGGPLGISTGVAADRTMPTGGGMSQNPNPNVFGGLGTGSTVGATQVLRNGLEDSQRKQDLKE